MLALSAVEMSPGHGFPANVTAVLILKGEVADRGFCLTTGNYTG